MSDFKTKYEIDKYIRIFHEEKRFQDKLSEYEIELNDSKYNDLISLLLDNKDYITNNDIDYLSHEDPPFLRDEISDLFSKDFITKDLYSIVFYTFKYSTIKKFFRENWQRFTPDFDVLNITKADQLKLFQESLMSEFDRLADTIDEIYNVQDIDKIPSQYLDYLGQLIGYEREERELLVDASFRELIKNIIEIYRIKGSNFSFELFFGFLGFDVKIDEFWFDKRYFDSGINLNPLTLTDNKTDFNFYLTTKKPTETVPSGMINPYTVKEEQVVETLGALEFARFIQTGQYTIDQLLGEVSGYPGTPYSFFKTNIIEFKLTRLSSIQNVEAEIQEGEASSEEDAGGLDERELRIILLYVNFLIPIFISRRVSIIIFPYEDDANSLIVKHRLFVNHAEIFIKSFYEDTYDKIYNQNNPDSIYSQISGENPEWSYEEIIKEIRRKLSDGELFSQYDNFFLGDRDLLFPTLDMKIGYPFIGVSKEDDFGEGTFPVFSKSSEDFLKTFNLNYNKFSYAQEPFTFPEDYNKAKILTITEEIVSGPEDEIGKGEIIISDFNNNFNIFNGENIKLQKQLIGDFEKGSNVIRNVEYSVLEAPLWQPFTYYEIGDLIRTPGSLETGADVVFECINDHESEASYTTSEAENFIRKFGIKLIEAGDLIYFPNEMFEYKIEKVIFSGESVKELVLNDNSPLTENNKELHTFRNFKNFIRVVHAPSFKNEGVFNVIKSERLFVGNQRLTRLITREPMNEAQAETGGFIYLYNQGRLKEDRIPFLYNVINIIPDLKTIMRELLGVLKEFTDEKFNDATIYTFEQLGIFQESSLKLVKVFKSTLVEFLNNIQDENILEYLDARYVEELAQFDDLQIKREFSSFGENQMNILDFYENNGYISGNKLTTVNINGTLFPSVSEQIVYDYSDNKLLSSEIFKEDSLNLENSFSTPEEEYLIADHYVTEDGWTRSIGYSYESKLTLDFLYNHLDYKAYSSFIIRIKTDNIGDSEDNQYTLHVGDGIFDYMVNWGDGNIEYFTTSDDQVHTYAVAGEYDIIITGIFPHMKHPVSGGDPAKLIDVVSWGSIVWGSMESMFERTALNNYSAINKPVLDNVFDMSNMFYQAVLPDPFDLSDWCVTNIATEPSNFGTFNGTTQLQPVWGTCPPA